MHARTTPKPLHLLAAWAMASTPFLPVAPALASDGEGIGVYAEGGQAAHGDQGTTTAATVGVLLPAPFCQPLYGGLVSSYFDVFVSHWRAPALDAGHRRYTQIGAIAVARYRFSAGRSPWFVEGGLGVSVMDRLYRTPDRTFSTTFQFTELIGLGRSFGERGEHELSLRLQHFSNAGIKKPNPGENFVRLRYAYRF